MNALEYRKDCLNFVLNANNAHIGSNDGRLSFYKHFKYLLVSKNSVPTKYQETELGELMGLVNGIVSSKQELSRFSRKTDEGVELESELQRQKDLFLAKIAESTSR